MITAAVRYRCDWGSDVACGATVEVALDLTAAVHRPEPPEGWVRVAERIYCPLHQVFIRPRDEGAAWSSAPWVEELPKP